MEARSAVTAEPAAGSTQVNQRHMRKSEGEKGREHATCGEELVVKLCDC